MYSNQNSIRTKFLSEKLIPEKDKTISKKDAPTLKVFEVARKIKSFEHLALFGREEQILPPEAVSLVGQHQPGDSRVKETAKDRTP